MKRIFLPVILLSVILETTHVTTPLTASLLTAMALLLGREAALVLFIGGVLLDVFSLRLLGLSGMYFLLIGMLTGRYQRKIFSGNLPYTFVILIASTVGYQWLFYTRIDIRATLLSIIVALTFLWVVNRIGMMEWKKGKGLQL